MQPSAMWSAHQLIWIFNTTHTMEPNEGKHKQSASTPNEHNDGFKNPSLQKHASKQKSQSNFKWAIKPSLYSVVFTPKLYTKPQHTVEEMRENTALEGKKIMINSYHGNASNSKTKSALICIKVGQHKHTGFVKTLKWSALMERSHLVVNAYPKMFLQTAVHYKLCMQTHT